MVSVGPILPDGEAPALANCGSYCLLIVPMKLRLACSTRRASRVMMVGLSGVFAMDYFLLSCSRRRLSHTSIGRSSLRPVEVGADFLTGLRGAGACTTGLGRGD